MGVLDHFLFFGPFFGRGSGPLGPGAFFTLLRAKSPLLQPIVILWGARGLWRTCCLLVHFGALGPFVGIFWRNTSAASLQPRRSMGRRNAPHLEKCI